MKKILLTGFQPFDTHDSNPSQILAQSLSKDLGLDHIILPVSFQRAIEALNAHLASRNYDFILMMGLASERDKICLERIGVNLKESKIPDADGVYVKGEKIDPLGAESFFSELPLQAWIENSEMLVSDSAGAYVCNFLYYNVLKSPYGKKSLFVHLPKIKDSSHEEKIKKELLGLIQKISAGLSAQ